MRESLPTAEGSSNAAPPLTSPLGWRWTQRATWIAIGGSSAFAAIYAAQTIALQSTESRPIAAWPIVLISAAQWWLWALAAPLVMYTADRFDVARRPRSGALAVHAGLAIGVSLVHAMIVSAIAWRLALSAEAPRYAQIFSSYAFSRLQANLLIYVGLLVGHWGLRQSADARERAVRAAALEGQLARAELDALRMQLNPHFLFNTLHAIRTLVDTDAPAARQMLVRLGDLLHATLDASARQELTLAEELGLVRGYLEIEATRFADRLTVRIDVPSALETARVPSFALQPLAENAIRHGIAQRVAGGSITLRAHADGATLVLTMRNDAPAVPNGDSRGHGMGLTTLRARLTRLYGAAASCTLTHETTGTAAVELRMPLRLSPT